MWQLLDTPLHPSSLFLEEEARGQTETNRRTTMDLTTLQTFFGWSTLIHMGLLIVVSLMLIALSNWVYTIHSKWFPMPRETHTAVVYSFLGVYKLMIFVFALVPWLTLLILNR
jgi:Family of unknown function (DUF6868)